MRKIIRQTRGFFAGMCPTRHDTEQERPGPTVVRQGRCQRQRANPAADGRRNGRPERRVYARRIELAGVPHPARRR